MKRRGSYLFLLIFWGSLSAFAQKSYEPVEPVQTVIPAEPYEDDWKDPADETTLEDRFIDSNIAISSFFDEVADGFDTFLVGKKRVTKRKNETSVKIQNSTFAVDGEGTKNTTSLGVNLRLPNVEEYWQLKFTSYDESEERRGVQKGYLRQTPRERNYGATVGLFRKLGNIRTSFQPRVDLGDPLRVAHSLTFDSVAEFPSYSVSPKIEFFTSPTDGVGTYQSLNFFIPLTTVYSLTFINNGEYSERTHLYLVANGVSLGKLVSNRSTIAYNLIFNSINQSNYHLEGYGLSVAWSHLIYQKILDYQIIPHLDFPRERSFRGTAGLIFNLNLNF